MGEQAERERGQRLFESGVNLRAVFFFNDHSRLGKKPEIEDLTLHSQRA
jgi:hypothetical protein